jgi:hypothetical protein
MYLVILFLTIMNCLITACLFFQIKKTKDELDDFIVRYTVTHRNNKKPSDVVTRADLSNYVTNQDAINIFQGAIGGVNKRLNDLESDLKIRMEYFLTKETATDLFKEYQSECVDLYKKYKDQRWDRLKDAFTRQ